MVTQGQKSGPQGTKMEPQGLPNHSFGSNKSSCQQSTCQQSTCQQSPCQPVERGAGGRGEALRYAYISIYIWLDMVHTWLATSRENIIEVSRNAAVRARFRFIDDPYRNVYNINNHFSYSVSCWCCIALLGLGWAGWVLCGLACRKSMLKRKHSIPKKQGIIHKQTNKQRGMLWCQLCVGDCCFFF
jgi:hypothetical protein